MNTSDRYAIDVYVAVSQLDIICIMSTLMNTI